MSDAPYIKIETITPELAATMLGTMAGNRQLRQRMVQRYAREMIAGKWLLNGEAIKVDRSGRLIDGQHRLNAVLMAKVPVKMMIVRGVDEKAMITLDTGIARSFYDVGLIAGRHYAQAVGPIARWWYKYEAGSPTTGKFMATHQELEAIRLAHPAIEDSASFIYALKMVRTRCVPSVQGFVHAYASEKYDREMADTFMMDLNEGADLAKSSPIYHPRRRLIDDDVKGRLESSHVLALTIKAWNAWVEGARIDNLRWRTGGNQPEEFPRFGKITPGARYRRKEKDRGVHAELHGSNGNSNGGESASVRPRKVTLAVTRASRAV